MQPKYGTGWRVGNSTSMPVVPILVYHWSGLAWASVAFGVCFALLFVFRETRNAFRDIAPYRVAILIMFCAPVVYLFLSQVWPGAELLLALGCGAAFTLGFAAVLSLIFNQDLFPQPQR